MIKRWILRFLVTVSLVLVLTALIAGMPGGLSGPVYAPRFSFVAYLTSLTGMLSDIATGSLGITRYGENAFVRAITYYGRSLTLLWKALVIALACGVAVGLLGRGRLRGLRLGATVALSSPDFLIVMFLQLALISLAHAGVRVPGWTAGGGVKSLLPALVLSLFPMAYVAQIVSAAAERVMAEDYIRTAVAKGLHPMQILRRHALRNVLVEALPSLSGLWGILTSNLIIVEYFFLWPGAGQRMVNCMADPRAADPRLATTLALLFAVTYLVLDAATVLAWRLLDPRVKGDARL